MPIEIRELIIKTTVENDQKGTNNPNGSGGDVNVSKLKKQLLDACKTYINEKVNEEKER